MKKIGENCCSYNRTLILILHNSTAEHVDADNTEQVGPAQDNDKHADVPIADKNTHL